MKVLSNMENMMVMVRLQIQNQNISIVYLIIKILQNWINSGFIIWVISKKGNFVGLVN